MRRWLCWGGSLVRLVSMFAWSYCTAVPMRSWRHMSTTWAVGIGKISLNNVFEFRLIKRCLQRTASTAFGTLVVHFMTEFIANRLKKEDSRDWKASRPALKKAIISSSVAMPELIDVEATIAGVWPLIFSYLKETGRKDHGDSLLVYSPSLNFDATASYPFILYL